MNNLASKRFPASWRLLGILGMVFTLLAACAEEKRSGTITVYKSPTCGCCNKWIAHLESENFNVVAHNRPDMNRVKLDLGVPAAMGSCHTAVIDGYIIEGHVPASAIKRLLKEKPSAAGLAVPGMPIGSPGMEGARKDPYHALIFNRSGDAAIYQSY